MGLRVAGTHCHPYAPLAGLEFWSILRPVRLAGG
jgi:hypothetical protein